MDIDKDDLAVLSARMTKEEVDRVWCDRESRDGLKPHSAGRSNTQRGVLPTPFASRAKAKGLTIPISPPVTAVAYYLKPHVKKAIGFWIAHY